MYFPSCSAACAVGGVVNSSKLAQSPIAYTLFNDGSLILQKLSTIIRPVLSFFTGILFTNDVGASPTFNHQISIKSNSQTSRPNSQTKRKFRAIIQQHHMSLHFFNRHSYSHINRSLLKKSHCIIPQTSIKSTQQSLARFYIKYEYVSRMEYGQFR